MTSERTAALGTRGRGAAVGRRQTGRLWLYGLLPLVLLAALLIVFFRYGPLGVFQGAFPPVEELTVDRATLSPGQIELGVTNGGPSPVVVAQVLVDEAYWAHSIEPADRIIPRLGRATITIPYPWVEGETHHITLISESGVTFNHTIEVATDSPRPNRLYLLTFGMIGVYVGVVPVMLGVLWFPFLRRLEVRWVHFFLSLTAGLLVFLGVDALHEALEVVPALPAAFQGTSMVAIGFLAAVLVLVGLARVARERWGTPTGLLVAYLIATGIGLHNLGEGLAIGAAYNLGKVALGTFLIVGFMLHNTTEGLGIVSPIAREGAALRHLILLGVIAGVPTILGAWIGGFTYSPVLSTLFLAVGAGAIFHVVYEIFKWMSAEAGRELATPLNVVGFALGLVIMYATGLLIAA